MQSTVSVALLPQLLPGDWARAGAIAVVIDTLRFTSTACVALSAGASAITVVSDIERAKQLAAASHGRLRLCGERACVRIGGFDRGNSPAEYTPSNVAGYELIFSTTNGTVAVEAALPAHEILLASLLNRAAVCEWLGRAARPPALRNESSTVWCVCAGTDGQVALEDVLTAGAIIERLRQAGHGWQLGNDASLLALDAWKSVAISPGNAAIVDRMHDAIGGRNLVEAGFADDLVAVAQLDSLTAVPCQSGPRRFENGG